MPAADRAIREWTDFGPNPGNLRMLTYKPASAPRGAGLVVVLHGCTQGAASFAEGAGWLALADRHGFGVLLPEQQRPNNQNLCFNWFLPQHTRRGAGEAASIHAMIARAIEAEGFDAGRVFVTGLSAGGAMAAVMLATYPETFAAGAIVAGLPYGGAGNVQEAFHSMFQVRRHDAPSWGEKVRAASGHRGPYPRIAIWHGTGDQTVLPGNAEELAKQWLDVHGLPHAPSESASDGGSSHRIWRDGTGVPRVEQILVEGMAHGVPVDAALADGAGGSEGPFLLDVGVASSLRIAQSWGLAPGGILSAEAPQHRPTVVNGAATALGAAARSGPDAIIRAALRKAGLLTD
jgi:feruloyl esterase